MWKRTNKLLLENNLGNNRTSRNPSESLSDRGNGRSLVTKEIKNVKFEKYSMSTSIKVTSNKESFKQDARALVACNSN